MVEAAFASLGTPGQVLNEDDERLRLSACVLSASTMY